MKKKRGNQINEIKEPVEVNKELIKEEIKTH